MNEETILKTRTSIYATMTIMMFASIALMFFIKYTVYSLRQEISLVQEQIDKNIEDSRILEAEWAYLTSPERIHTLMKNIENFKDYSNVSAKQIKSPEKLKPYYSARSDKYGTNENVALGDFMRNESYY